MILFLLLVFLLMILTAITVLVLGTGGVVFIIIFGDVIVCIGIIIWILCKIFGKKNKK